MATTEAKSLMSIATDSNLRIHERIKIIKGIDKKISSVAEAKAILAIPSKDLMWADNKENLPIVQMEAQNYLKEHEKQIKEKQKLTDDDSLLTKGAAIVNEINKGVKTIGQVLSFAEKIKRGFPIYF